MAVSSSLHERRDFAAGRWGVGHPRDAASWAGRLLALGERQGVLTFATKLVLQVDPGRGVGGPPRVGPEACEQGRRVGWCRSVYQDPLPGRARGFSGESHGAFGFS